MEHRCGVRRPARCVVTLIGPSGISGHGMLRDISISGAFVESASICWRRLVLVEMRINVPGRAGMTMFRVDAMAVRATHRGLGLMFDRLHLPLVKALTAAFRDGHRWDIERVTHPRPARTRRLHAALRKFEPAPFSIRLARAAKPIAARRAAGDSKSWL